MTLADEIGDWSDKIELTETSETRDEAENSLIKAFRRIGIKAHKHLDPTRDKNFDTY